MNYFVIYYKLAVQWVSHIQIVWCLILWMGVLHVYCVNTST